MINNLNEEILNYFFKKKKVKYNLTGSQLIIALEPIIYPSKVLKEDTKDSLIVRWNIMEKEDQIEIPLLADKEDFENYFYIFSYFSNIWYLGLESGLKKVNLGKGFHFERMITGFEPEKTFVIVGELSRMRFKIQLIHPCQDGVILTPRHFYKL